MPRACWTHAPLRPCCPGTGTTSPGAATWAVRWAETPHPDLGRPLWLPPEEAQGLRSPATFCKRGLITASPQNFDPARGTQGLQTRATGTPRCVLVTDPRPLQIPVGNAASSPRHLQANHVPNQREAGESP